jgi:hypothetical protein
MGIIGKDGLFRGWSGWGNPSDYELRIADWGMGNGDYGLHNMDLQIARQVFVSRVFPMNPKSVILFKHSINRVGAPA